MRKFVFSMLFLLVASQLSAQVKLGVRGGLNISDMSTNSSALKADNRLGYYFGPTVKLTLPILGLGLDGSVLYNSLKTKLEATDVSPEQTVKQETLDIPVHVRYTIGLSKVASVFIYGGPQFSYNIGGKKQGDWEWKDYTKSANIGGGVTLIDHLQLNVNYNFHFDSSGNDLFYGAGKAHQWQIGAAYFF